MEQPPFSNSLIRYAYDQLGRLDSRKVDGEAVPETFGYDHLGRLVDEVTDKESTMINGSHLLEGFGLLCAGVFAVFFGNHARRVWWIGGKRNDFYSHS